MYLLRILVCGLFAYLLTTSGLAAERKRPREATEAQAPQVSDERTQLKQLGYELLTPFRDCAECPEMMVIPAGGFQMGSPEDEVGRYSDEAPQHPVTLGRAFAMAKTEVTQGQWRALMGSDPSYFSACGDQCPVEQVTWNDARNYALKLAESTGKHYRLPTEAEWEYAARAGTQTTFNTGNCIYTEAANFDGHYDYRYCHAIKSSQKLRVLPVGSFAANGFALHDMHGNVWEWVEDCWHESYAGAPNDGSAWTSGNCEKRVLRGGSWNVEPKALRSAQRNWEWMHDYNNAIGFRVALTLTEQGK